MIRNKKDAEIWEERLARVADSQCRATALSKGPSLLERLQPAFSAVDRYIAKVGNLNDVFASEFRYFQEAPADQRSEAERLASLIGNIGESSEKVQLACLIVFLFASEVEGRTDAFLGAKWHEDPSATSGERAEGNSCDFRACVSILHHITSLHSDASFWLRRTVNVVPHGK
ncbi:MAG: hypothetical protein K2X38_12555 [Gemmataceae bacterium]|nr:hypothetical protein [Gemmataceae bacterium]